MKPRKGDPIKYNDVLIGHVLSADHSICWIEQLDGEATCFIWRFKDGLNTMHDWPSKEKASQTMMDLAPIPQAPETLPQFTRRVARDLNDIIRLEARDGRDSCGQPLRSSTAPK